MNDVEKAIEVAGFNAFVQLIEASGYAEMLEGGREYTIFAPTDKAFSKVTASALKHFKRDAKLLRTVVGYHLAAGRVLSRRFVGKRIRAVMIAGGSVMIADRKGLYVNKAKLVQPDIVIGASIVHGIDGVLWPEEPPAAVSESA